MTNDPIFFYELKREVTGQQIIDAILQYAGLRRFKEERVPTGPKAFVAMYGSSGFIVSASSGRQDQPMYDIEPSKHYRVFAVELYSWSERSKQRYPIKSPTQVRAELNRIGDELTRLLEGQPQGLPHIAFTFQDRRYVVPPEVYTQDRQIYLGASGSLILTVKDWDTSVTPPYPSTIYHTSPTIVAGPGMTVREILDEGGILARST